MRRVAVMLVSTLLVAVAPVGSYQTPRASECIWTVKGIVSDPTNQPIKGKVLRLWSQPATGPAADPQTTGPREMGWPETTTNDNGAFVVTVTKPLTAASCTSGRMFGGTVGTNKVDIGLYGPLDGPRAVGPHTADLARIGPAVMADEIK